jgi:hypothetical protein
VPVRTFSHFRTSGMLTNEARCSKTDARPAALRQWPTSTCNRSCQHDAVAARIVGSRCASDEFWRTAAAVPHSVPVAFWHLSCGSGARFRRLCLGMPIRSSALLSAGSSWFLACCDRSWTSRAPAKLVGGKWLKPYSRKSIRAKDLVQKSTESCDLFLSRRVYSQTPRI